MSNPNVYPAPDNRQPVDHYGDLDLPSITAPQQGNANPYGQTPGLETRNSGLSIFDLDDDPWGDGSSTGNTTQQTSGRDPLLTPVPVAPLQPFGAPPLAPPTRPRRRGPGHGPGGTPPPAGPGRGRALYNKLRGTPRAPGTPRFVGMNALKSQIATGMEGSHVGNQLLVTATEAAIATEGVLRFVAVRSARSAKSEIKHKLVAHDKLDNIIETFDPDYVNGMTRVADIRSQLGLSRGAARQLSRMNKKHIKATSTAKYGHTPARSGATYLNWHHIGTYGNPANYVRASRQIRDRWASRRVIPQAVEAYEALQHHRNYTDPATGLPRRYTRQEARIQASIDHRARVKSIRLGTPTNEAVSAFEHMVELGGRRIKFRQEPAIRRAKWATRPRTDRNGNRIDQTAVMRRNSRTGLLEEVRDDQRHEVINRTMPPAERIRMRVRDRYERQIDNAQERAENRREFIDRSLARRQIRYNRIDALNRRRAPLSAQPVPRWKPLVRGVTTNNPRNLDAWA